MNAYDIQQVLVTNLNALEGLPLTQATLHTYKTNILNTVKDMVQSDPIVMVPLTETQSMQLCGSNLILIHIFYAMCLYWAPKVNIIFENKVTTITKDGLINNEKYPLELGPVLLYIKDGDLIVEHFLTKR